MKIFHIIDSLGRGGKERRLVELLKGIRESEEVKCELGLMSNEIDYPEIHDLDIKIHYLIRNWRKDPRIFTSMYRLCKKGKPDIIHSWESMCSIYALPTARLLGIKFINAMITDARERLQPFSKSCVRSKLTFPLSDMIVSNSFAGLRSYRPPPNRSCCIHNGFDMSRLTHIRSTEEIRQRFDIKTEKVVGKVASFSEFKDYGLYIESAQKILSKRDDVTFLAVGNGNKLRECKSLVRPEFKDKIRFLGKQDDVESIINIFDVGVLCTNWRVQGEGLSNSIMEYMALGKSVVANDTGGTKELVLDGRTGFLVKPGSLTEMTERIVELLDNSGLSFSMGQAGRKRVAEDFNLEKMTRSYINLYRKIMGKPERGDGNVTWEKDI